MIFIKRTSNTINFIIFTILLSGVFYPAQNVLALSGREIMEKVNARDVGAVSYTHLTLPTTPYV